METKPYITLLGEGSGTSKQGAQQEAARDALNRMGAVSGN